MSFDVIVKEHLLQRVSVLGRDDSHISVALFWLEPDASILM
jgi:hypothetical protein